MKIHFIGIGGIGISGLAQFMHFQGHKVSGSDIAQTVITKKLTDMGIEVTIPHSADAIKDQDLVIHSAIIKPSNPEVIAAKEKGIKVISRKEAIKDILADKKVYAVAGAHGKSTTTAILAAILEDSSAIIGAESKAFGSNVRYNQKSDVVVFEADESDGSFLNANPYCSIVINAEMEHMEFYNYDEELFYSYYKEFINKAKLRVLNAEDPFLATLEGKIDAIWLSPSKDIKNISYVLRDDEPHTRFELKDLGFFEVWGFGEHIALDAALAILAAKEVMDIDTIRSNLLKFKGIKKRFDIITKEESRVIIDDYGHHPTEIKATLQSVKEYAKLKGLEKIVALWQPHKYSRTVDNIEGFVECFAGVDELVILPVWSAGEEKREIDFATLFDRYNVTFVEKITQTKEGLKLFSATKELKTLSNGVLVGFGAGDITYQIRGIQ